MIESNLWNQILVWPIINLLIAFYKAFEFLRIPGSLGWAVIGLTIAIRLLLYPLTRAQLVSAKKIAALKPHMDVIQSKHKGDKKGLQEAQLALYKEHGVNPAAGCLPLLLQLPVLIALYNVFYQVLGNGDLAKVVTEINQVVYHQALKLTTLDFSFFGINLGLKPSEWQSQGGWLLAIPIVTGLLQWWQTKLMLPQGSGAKVQSPNTKQTVNSKSENTKEEKKPEDTAAEVQKQMAIISPIMFGYFAFQFPVGLALYWNVFGLFGIMQQLRVNKHN